MATQYQSQMFLYEAFDLISNTTILGVFYGIAFTLYCLCAQLLYPQLREPDKRRQARFTLSYISLVLFFATVFLVSNARKIQLAYVDHADYPGGPQKYEDSYNPTTDSYEMAGSVSDLIVEVLTMTIQIWRLWIIWSGTRYVAAVTILPLLLLLSYIALDTPIDIVNAVVPSDQFGISTQNAVVMDTVKYAVLSVFTMLVTGLVIARLLLVRRCYIRMTGTPDPSSPYMSIIAVLTESYALDSAWSIASTLSIALDSDSNFLFVINDSTVKVIAYFLIVYRVSTGRGWTKETERKLTSLQWNSEVWTATDQANGICSQVPATTPVVAGGSRPVSRSGSAV